MLDIKFLKNKYALLFFIYAVVLILFTACSYKIMFHDTWEYMAVAKKFAGFLNSNVYITHSLAYPLFLSFFARYFHSILTMKLVNVSWIILIGIFLYNLDLKKTAFFIWVFSPIAWMSTVMISPLIPVSFFLLIAYLSIKKWQENKKTLYFIISALMLGLATAFHDIFLFLGAFFVIAFFYDRKVRDVIFFLLFAFLSFSLRLILDASLFSLAIKDKLFPFPIYSLIRFLGCRLVIQLGLHPYISEFNFSFFSFASWGFLILISPLLFYLYKINYKENKGEIIFLILSTILFLLQGGYIYFIILAPIIAILLSKFFGRKELLLHIIISSFITLLMVYPYFIEDKQEIEKQNLEIKDLKMIADDFSFDAVVFNTETLATLYIWDKNLPFMVSYEERNSILQNNQYYTHYDFEVKPKIDVSEILEIKAGLKPNIKEGIDYQNLPILLERGETPPEGYRLTKCYNLLCVYEKEQINLKIYNLN